MLLREGATPGSRLAPSVSSGVFVLVLCQYQLGAGRKILLVP